MEFMPAAQLLHDAAEGGYAVPAFCTWGAETTNTVLRVASDHRAPVILMSSQIEFAVMPPAQQVRVARAVAAAYDIPVALHLDHADSISCVEECVDAGYTSVMLDFSTRPFAENAAALRRVVDRAHPLGVSVEGEIGTVGHVEAATSEGAELSALTDPDEAKAYVELTGVDALAVSIGNAHGNYARCPRLDFGLLATLRRATGVPLVLHGGSGTPPADIRRAISLGIAKVNVASELVRAVRQALLEQWQAGDALWVPAAYPLALEALSRVVEKWIRITGAAGKA